MTGKRPWGDRRGARGGSPRRRVVLVFLAALQLLFLPRPDELLCRAAPRAQDRACVVALRHSATVQVEDAWGLRGPEALAVDHRGNILIADTGNHRVITIASDGEVLNEFGGYGWREGRFDTPTDLSVSPGFYVYVLDEGNRRIVRFDVNGDYVDTVLDEDAAGAPVGIDVAQSGEILVVDTDSQVVRMYSQFAEAADPIGDFGSWEGGLIRPQDVAMGPGREIAVADVGRNSVLVFDEFGSHLYSLSAADTLLPADVTFDRNGNILVADASKGRVLAFARGGGPPTAAIGSPVAGETFSPTSLAIDGDGNLVVLDSDGLRIVSVEMTYGDCSRLR